MIKNPAYYRDQPRLPRETLDGVMLNSGHDLCDAFKELRPTEDGIRIFCRMDTGEIDVEVPPRLESVRRTIHRMIEADLKMREPVR